jgi:hypothetical protein
LIAEAVFDHWNTLGGFDITRNNMPFPSNEMDMSRIGFNFKYDMPFHPQLSITGNVMTTIVGRNVGQATGFNAGIFYVIDFTKKKKNDLLINQKNDNHEKSLYILLIYLFL